MQGARPRVWAITRRTLLTAWLLLAMVAVSQAQAPGPAGEPRDLRKHPKLHARLLDLLSRTPPGTLRKQGPTRVDDVRRVQVFIRAEPISQALRAQVLALGGTVDGQGLGVLQAWVPLSALETLAALPEVRTIRPADHLRPNLGSVTTEGDTILGTATVRQQFGVTGQGARIGVISGGIQGLEASIASGNLPPTTFHCQAATLVITLRSSDCLTGEILIATTGGVTATPFPAGTDLATDPEGTAMLEIIHDLAPGAELWFASADTSVDVQAATSFLAANVDVVLSDLGALDFFPNGQSTLAQGLVQLLAVGSNRARGYMQSAGNYALQHYADVFRNSGTYDPFGFEGTFHVFLANTDTTGPPTSSVWNQVTVPPSSSVDIFLTWNDPAGASTNDYDLILSDCNGTLFDWSNSLQDGSQEPVEVVSYTNPSRRSSRTVCYAILNYQNAAQPRTLNILIGTVDSIGHAFNTPAKSLAVPADTPGDFIAVGAVPASSPNQIEDYSSLGPTFDGRSKPDLVATDGVSVSGAGGFDSPFFGTSAAVPHVAGLAALLLQLNPTLTRAQLKTVLMQSAVPLGDGNVFGAGRIDGMAAATQALASLSFPLNVTVTGTGTGSVSSIPAGITCGTTCSQIFSGGTVITLTATPGAGSVFSGWSGAGCSGTGSCTVTMTQTQTATATFAPANPSLALSLNQSSFRSGQSLSMGASVTPGGTPLTADVYVALQLPGGSLIFLQGDGSLTTGLHPIVSNWTVGPFSGQIFSYNFGGAEPSGGYAWLAAFTQPGTMNFIGSIISAPFSFGP